MNPAVPQSRLQFPLNPLQLLLALITGSNSGQDILKWGGRRDCSFASAKRLLPPCSKHGLGNGFITPNILAPIAGLGCTLRKWIVNAFYMLAELKLKEEIILLMLNSNPHLSVFLLFCTCKAPRSKGLEYIPDFQFRLLMQPKILWQPFLGAIKHIFSVPPILSVPRVLKMA